MVPKSVGSKESEPVVSLRHVSRSRQRETESDEFVLKKQIGSVRRFSSISERVTQKDPVT